MKSLKLFSVLLLLVSTLAFAEKQRDWEMAKVVSQDLRTHAGAAYVGPYGPGLMVVPMTYTTNVVVVETRDYQYTWYELSKQKVVLPVHGSIRFYRDGNKFIVLDTAGKKHKFSPQRAIALH
jgi:hypothetical protein